MAHFEDAIWQALNYGYGEFLHSLVDALALAYDSKGKRHHGTVSNLHLRSIQGHVRHLVYHCCLDRCPMSTI